MKNIDPGKMKNLIITISLGLFIVFGGVSCGFRILQPPPAPTVLEEEKLPYKVAILPFAN